MNLHPEHQTYIVDRLEDNGWAVLERENGETFNLPLFFLPPVVREGDVVVVEKMPSLEELTDDPSTTLDIYIDHDAGRVRQEQARALRNRLPKAPEGDLEL